MSFYPPKIQNRFDSPKNSGVIAAASADGRSASFQCGSFVSFSLRIDADAKMVSAAAFRSNGCGYMIAAADYLVETVIGRKLSELNGLNQDELQSKIHAEFEAIPDDRLQCVEVCIDALREAFADFRGRQIEEFRGEKVLVCSCFGVTEERIEDHLRQMSIKTVEDVSQVCNAGSGCGSCRMLIQEMIDSSEFQL